ncbi:hypothetical protein V496_06217 [Pseudogymnoascus sp. VKM F-4515 (FW-2607)]|nr:hypothetical protein V496_06217 [Pseudogymnoascus sp. VKM F-4515 (FW-2607)]
MTMFRGEAANHGIADVASLVRELFAETDDSAPGPFERVSGGSGLDRQQNEEQTFIDKPIKLCFSQNNHNWLKISTTKL